jgi:RNA polymerase sigma-70 factor (ECF subfamily)
VSTGDHLDFADFYRREFPRLARTLRPLLGHSADDVTQEAFVVASVRWAEVAVLDAPYAWVRRVALRMASRTGHRERHRVDLETRQMPVDLAGPRVPDFDTIAAMRDLPVRHAVALWLHHVGDRSMREVAADLECSEGAAKVLVHRARRTLAEQAIGLRGRWVTATEFSTDRIARVLSDRGEREHVDTVIDDLGGRGGRWVFTVDAGRYSLHRDDGLELDRGDCWFGGGVFHFAPKYGTGEFGLRVDVDADVAWFQFVTSTTPPTLGVPDEVWSTLYYSSSSFEFAGRPRPAV